MLFQAKVIGDMQFPNILMKNGNHVAQQQNNEMLGSLTLSRMVCSDDHRNGALEGMHVAGKKMWKRQ